MEGVKTWFYCSFYRMLTLHTPHYENVPFEVPKGWVWTTIGNLCSKIGSGSTPKGSNYSSEGILFFRSQNVHNDGIVLDDIKYISDEVHQSMIGTEVLPNDLLLNITGGSLGRCAIVPNEIDKGNVSQHVCILRPITISSNYFHALILSTFFSKSMKITGSGREGLPKYNLEQMMFPLPPLAEQKRIVSEIERWFSLIDIIENDKQDLQNIVKQAKSKILDLAIHGKLVPQDPNDEPASELLKRINPDFTPCDNAHYTNLPDSWCLVDIKSIFTINPKNKIKDDIITGFVAMTDIADGYSNKFKFTPRSWGDIKKGFTHFSEGDIVVAKISPCLENRKSAIITSLPNGIGAGSTELIVFRSQCVLPEYGLYFFKSDFFINHCVNSFSGVVGQQRISKSTIENIAFPLPPIAEQRKIIDRIRIMFTKLDTIKESL